MQPINMIMRQVQWRSFETDPVQMHPLSYRQQIKVFINYYYVSFKDMLSYFEFLVSVINHHHINRLRLF